MSYEEKVGQTTETLEQIAVQFDEIQSWMFSDGDWLYPDQLVMIEILKLLTDSTKKSCENRFDGEDDGNTVEYATKLLWQIHDERTLKELHGNEA